MIWHICESWFMFRCTYYSILKLLLNHMLFAKLFLSIHYSISTPSSIFLPQGKTSLHTESNFCAAVNMSSLLSCTEVANFIPLGCIFCSSASGYSSCDIAKPIWCAWNWLHEETNSKVYINHISKFIWQEYYYNQNKLAPYLANDFS